MDTKSLLESILTFTIGTASVSTVIIAISKRVFDKWLQARLTKYDYELKIKLEEHKLEKQKINEENKIRFTKLHEERAEVIKNLYSKLVDMSIYLKLYVLDFKNGNYYGAMFEDDRKNLKKSASDFIKYANKNRIFFDEKIIFYLDEIEAIIMTILDSYEKEFEDGSDFKSSSEWNEITMKMVNEEIPEFKHELELKFRNILGVE